MSDDRATSAARQTLIESTRPCPACRARGLVRCDLAGDRGGGAHRHGGRLKFRPVAADPVRTAGADPQPLNACQNLLAGVHFVDQGDLNQQSALSDNFATAMAIGIFRIYAVLVL